MSRAILAFEAFVRAEKSLNELFLSTDDGHVRETLRLVLIDLTPAQLLLTDAFYQKEDSARRPPADPPDGERKKCDRPTGRFTRWCAGMSLALTNARENGEGKGLCVASGWREKDPPGSLSRVFGVTYRARLRTDGIILNFCPWCGEPIRFDETETKVGA